MPIHYFSYEIMVCATFAGHKSQCLMETSLKIVKTQLTVDFHLLQLSQTSIVCVYGQIILIKVGLKCKHRPENGNCSKRMGVGCKERNN